MTDTNIYLISLLVGQLVPPVTDLINKHVPSANIRFLASLLVSLVIALALNYNRIVFGSPEELLLTGTIIFSSAQVAYKFWYDKSQYQANIRHNAAALPLKELIPPVDSIAPKLQSIKSHFIKPAN